MALQSPETETIPKLSALVSTSCQRFLSLSSEKLLGFKDAHTGDLKHDKCVAYCTIRFVTFYRNCKTCVTSYEIAEFLTYHIKKENEQSPPHTEHRNRTRERSSSPSNFPQEKPPS